MITLSRFTQLEKLLRRLRNDARLFGDDETAFRIQLLIRKVKARLMPVYDQRHRERVNAQFERDYAIDVAINHKYR
jgi:hypothetical protein